MKRVREMIRTLQLHILPASRLRLGLEEHDDLPSLRAQRLGGNALRVALRDGVQHVFDRVSGRLLDLGNNLGVLVIEDCVRAQRLDELMVAW